MNNGDIVNWEFKEPPNNYTEAYWCKDGMAVYYDGLFYDTYWMHWDGNKFKQSSSGFVFSEFYSPGITFKLICNQHEIKVVEEAEAKVHPVWYNLSYQKNCKSLFAIPSGSSREFKMALDALQKKYYGVCYEHSRSYREKESILEMYNSLKCGIIEVEDIPSWMLKTHY